MMMPYFEFPVLTDEEIEKLGFLDEGVYEFVVEKVTPGVSKAGNNKIDLTLKVMDKGESFFIFDCLVATKNMTYKIKHFCETVGLGKEYALGKINPEIWIGRNGKLDLYIQKGNVKPDGSKYKDKMAVRDYIREKDMSFATITPLIKEEKPKQEFVSDDVPF